MNMTLKKVGLLSLSLILVIVLLLLNFNLSIDQGKAKLTVTVGDPVNAAGISPDVNGTTSTAVQTALDMVANTGGEVYFVSSSYTFTGTVSRAIDNVVFKLNGATITNDGVTPLFDIGSQKGWSFYDGKLDAGGITLSSGESWTLNNVWFGTTYYSLRTDQTIYAGNVSAPTGRGATYILAASDATDLEKAQADAVCLGSNDDIKIQAAITALTNGGVIKLLGHIFNTSAQITIPEGLSFTFEGEGVPKQTIYAIGSISTTPTDGTQIRGPASFLTSGTYSYMFFRTTGSGVKGTLTFKDLALMPAWGTTAASTYNYVLRDDDGSSVTLDNVMIMPWGWIEACVAGSTMIMPTLSSAGAGNYICSFYFANGGGNEVSNLTITRLYMIGLAYCGYWHDFDCVYADQIYTVWCTDGPNVGVARNCYINNLVNYCFKDNVIEFATPNSSQGNQINEINYITLENQYSSAGVKIVALNTNTYVKVNRVTNYPATYAYKTVTITSADARLIGNCIAYNMGNNAQTETYPKGKLNATPFGDTIATPFKDTTTYAIGTSGTNANPTSARTYTANEPVNVTISGGTGVSITTRDTNSNVIDNAVASLTNRLLLSGYTITVTYTGAPTTTVIQATIGANGTTATPIANVNYVCGYYGLFVTLSGGTDVSVTTYDGSTNAMGNIMDASMTALTRYRLQPGQIINLGNFSDAPATLTVNRE